MKETRALVSFWITVVSFVGSIIFITHLLIYGEQRSPEFKDCMDKMLYYQHRADSLQRELDNAALSNQ